MPWWGWLVVGAVLLATETVIQTDFWLALLGVAAFAMAALVRFGLIETIWIQWAAFGVLAVFFSVFVRRRIHKLVAPAPGLKAELIGEYGTVQTEIAPAGVGTIELRGSNWKARNVGDSPLAVGARVRVEAVDGFLLDVRV
ncbi:MAG: NfeD family protein [Deltaproteobacteria bacterium]|nr:NfeD family protein [Deltaproteobacteria bacterium]